MPFVLFSAQDGCLLGGFVLESSEWLCPGTSPKVAGTVGETSRGFACNTAFVFSGSSQQIARTGIVPSAPRHHRYKVAPK